jgi:hypothetical protein
MPWALVTYSEGDHAFAPEVYPYKWRARAEAHRLAKVLQDLGLDARAGGPEDEGLARISIRVVGLDAPRELSHPVFIGSGWAPKGYVSPEAVLLMTASAAEEWVTAGAVLATTTGNWSFHSRDESGRIRAASMAKLVK